MVRSQQYIVNGQPQRTTKQRIGRFLYNKQKGTICGRTCKSWGVIGAFYMVFYMVVAGMFSGCMLTMLHFIPDDLPFSQVYYEMGNAINTQPGMTFLPQDVPSLYDDVLVHKAPLQTISYSMSDPDSYSDYVTQLRMFLLNEYRNDSAHYAQNCDNTTKATPCDLSLAQFEPECWDSNNPDNFTFGYDTGSPCVLLRINKLHNWEPEEYASNPDSATLDTRWSPGSLPIYCHPFVLRSGEPEFNVSGQEYLPAAGLGASCYPYCSRVTTYQTPVAMVKFHNITQNVKIPIMCQYYAQNVVIDRVLGTGSAIFNLQVNT